MRIAVVILAIAVAVLGVLYFQSARRTQEPPIVVSPQVMAPETDVGDIKTQLQAQTARVTELEQKVGMLEIEKKKVEDQLGPMQHQVETLKKDFEAVQRSMQEEETKLTNLEADRKKLVTQLGAVSNELVSVQDQLAALGRTNAANEAQIKALRQQQVVLEQEKASLEHRLNDLDALRAQIRVVKGELREKKVEEWKRGDEELAARGNRGFLLKNGRPQVQTPAVAPL
jgi:chromosome segregation ATPase